MEQDSTEKDPEIARTQGRNSYGSLISIFLILIVLVAGAYYVGHKRVVQYRQYRAASHAQGK